MSRAELDELQSRLKTAIQKHQSLVTKLQSQPQDGNLKQQLQNIQLEIMKMSQKQKLVVQNLRKDLIDRQINDMKQQEKQNVSDETESSNQDENISKSPLRVPNYSTAVEKNSTKSQGGSNVDISKPKTKVSPVTDEKKLKEQSCDKAKELKKKLDFMACIDLVPPDSVRDTPGKRSERKRKSTNNPNFAYGFELERRPRLSNYLASEYFGAKKSKPKPAVMRLEALPTTNGTSTTTITSSSPVLNTTCDNQFNNTKENLPTEALCHICGLCGQMILCDTCNHYYHLLCLEPPLQSLPLGTWKCPSCQESSCNSGNSSLSAVNTYISNKTAKEEEKRKLLKRSTELLQEKTHLENRTKQLNEILSRQGVRKQDLLDINVKAKQSVENLKNFIKVIQSS
ncbi:PHD finger protein 21B [Mactra antiquata]